jgi:glycosyltransferase involved in cell wall biosynthesis
MKVTVCVPTFNRKTQICKTIEGFEAILNNGEIKLIVSDNSSCDGTYEAINSYKYPGYTCRENDTPTFYSNVTNTFLACDTEWAMLMSDEDSVNFEELGALNSILQMNDVRTVITSTSNSETRRMSQRDTRDGKLNFGEIRVATYMSGICFKINSVRPIIHLMNEYSEVDPGNIFVQSYPHQALLWAIYAEYPVNGCTSRVIARGNPFFRIKEESKKDRWGIEDSFNSVTGRWKTWEGGYRWLACLQKEHIDKAGPSQAVEKMIRTHCNHLMSTLRAGISSSGKEYINIFNDSAISFADTLQKKKM